MTSHVYKEASRREVSLEKICLSLGNRLIIHLRALAK